MRFKFQYPYIKFYQYAIALIFSCTVYGCLHATTAELSSYSRDHMACKDNKIFTIQPFTKNVCLPPTQFNPQSLKELKLPGSLTCNQIIITEINDNIWMSTKMSSVPFLKTFSSQGFLDMTLPYLCSNSLNLLCLLPI